MYTDDYIIGLVIKGLQLRGLIFSSWSCSKLIRSDLYCSLLCHRSIISAISSLTPFQESLKKNGRELVNHIFRIKTNKIKLSLYNWSVEKSRSGLWTVPPLQILYSCYNANKPRRTPLPLCGLRSVWDKMWITWHQIHIVLCPLPRNKLKYEANILHLAISRLNPTCLIPRCPHEAHTIKCLYTTMQSHSHEVILSRVD